ncbi:MAG: DUF4445 domain-containing protein [Ruminococcaceae bacterium]|nr:DUF4445 domain-containing protein [Oscillospiraceae bacterium]
MKLYIKTNLKSAEITVNNEDNLMNILIREGFAIGADCGGHGKCGKCAVRITPVKDGAPISDKSESVLSCEYVPQDDVFVEFNEDVGSGLLDHKDVSQVTKKHKNANGYGAVLDIGTTTLAMYLVDLSGGESVKAVSELNPQRRYGADVISRIEACMNGKKDELHKIITEKTEEMLQMLCSDFGIEEVTEFYVTGNTTMLHLFLGEDPSGIGVFPFTPVFLDSKSVVGSKLGISAERIITAPCIASYIGGDTVCAAHAVDLSSGNNLLIDIGTNGEMILHTGGKYYSTSTAAGPALEGANITCGCGGILGAVNRVGLENGQVSYTTIGGADPVGICGAGLIDAVAVMLEAEIIDETGAFDDTDNVFQISKNVFVNEKDIREFQLAKSAIASGIKVLIKKSGLTYDTIDKVYIAGGLGFYIDKNSAAMVGLIPEELIGKIEVVGNAAALGAKLALLDENGIKKMNAIVSSSETVELANDPDFTREFVDNMFFM